MAARGRHWRLMGGSRRLLWAPSTSYGVYLCIYAFKRLFFQMAARGRHWRLMGGSRRLMWAPSTLYRVYLCIYTMYILLKASGVKVWHDYYYCCCCCYYEKKKQRYKIPSQSARDLKKLPQPTSSWAISYPVHTSCYQDSFASNRSNGLRLLQLHCRCFKWECTSISLNQP